MRALHSTIQVTDPDVDLMIQQDRDTDEENKRFGPLHVATLSIEEAEALYVILGREIIRAKAVEAALKVGQP